MDKVSNTLDRYFAWLDKQSDGEAFIGIFLAFCLNNKLMECLVLLHLEPIQMLFMWATSLLAIFQIK